MKSIELLMSQLEEDVATKDKKEAFKEIIEGIVNYFIDNLRVTQYEVAILLANEEKSILSFAAPEYLVDAGMIPVNSIEAVASGVFRRGRGVIENNLSQQKHLMIFEMIKTPDNERLTVFKMMGLPLMNGDEVFGVLEISRRGRAVMESGPDFTGEDLALAEKAIDKIAPLLYKVKPQDYRGKIT